MNKDDHGDADARAEALVAQWGLSVESVQSTPTSVVVFATRDGSPVVLKVSSRQSDEWNTGAVMTALAGPGMVKVVDQADGAVLMERLNPGTPLADLSLAGQDEFATDILANLIRNMAAGSPVPGVPSVLDLAQDLARYAGGSEGGIPPRWVADARAVFRDLATNAGPVQLLHGDLHHENVLRDEQRGWVVIDPKGVMGERACEVGAALRNPWEAPRFVAERSTVNRRLDQFSETLEVDRDRLVAWGFAQAVLAAVWCVEGGEVLTRSNPALALAETLRTMLTDG